MIVELCGLCDFSFGTLSKERHLSNTKYKRGKKGGTKNLNNHLNNKHKEIYEEAKTKQAKEKPRILPITTFCAKERQFETIDAVNIKIAEFFCSNNIPFSVFESKSFNEMCAILAQKWSFKPISRGKLSRIIEKRAQEIKTEVAVDGRDL